MYHLKLIQPIETRSKNYHVSLWSNQARIMAITQRIHQVAGMVELAQLLPKEKNRYLVKSLGQHLKTLTRQRTQYQQQSG